MRLEAFLPFVRNHNIIGREHPQEPYVFKNDSKILLISKIALRMRYSLL